VQTHRCQVQCWPGVSEGKAEIAPQSPRSHLKLILKRRLSQRTKRSLKTHSGRLIMSFSGLTGRSDLSPLPTAAASAASLKAGDLVRVRSRQEIQATLDSWKELKGCLFMEDMWRYCGTTQRVLKRVERFVDERDYQVKKCKGIALLEGLTCEGTADYGRCDRACFFFWREEWLEKID
jgi:hypothetical protein